MSAVTSPAPDAPGRTSDIGVVVVSYASAGTIEASLFRLLHEIDATGVARIAVAPIPHAGLGEAINDRLLRAAAPRHAT